MRSSFSTTSLFLGAMLVLSAPHRAAADDIRIPAVSDRPIKAAGLLAARADQCGDDGDAYRKRFLDGLRAQGKSPAELRSATVYFDESRAWGRSVFAAEPCTAAERAEIGAKTGARESGAPVE